MIEAAAPLVSVLMPTFEQAAFLPAAVESLLTQRMRRWQLVIVDDGSEDDTAEAAAAFTADRRVTYVRLPENRGLGTALNEGLRRSSAPLVAYLPSDDGYDPGHLAALTDLLEPPEAAGVVLAWSGVRHHGTGRSVGAPDGYPLQLVQVLHRRTDDRWTERPELETDDLERLFWARLRKRGATAATGTVTCEWRDHPAQRHKIIRECFDGGLNVFRRRYRVSRPLRFHSTDGWPVDEERLYARFRRRPPIPPATGGLRILLVGELAFNPERILALVERGHQLFGLWTDDGLGDHTVGPLPFGHVTDVPRRDWADHVRALRPDVIYALLNWRAVPFAHEVLSARLGVPFVWHFKEAPMRCQARGTWLQLVDLVARSDAVLFSSPEERDWFAAALPGHLAPPRTHVLDGDLPKADWFTGGRRPRLGERDGEIHTVAVGRPLGLDAGLVGRLAAANVHVHLHGAVRGAGPGGRWGEWAGAARTAAPRHFHVHPRVDPPDWVSTLSRYDAGWLHNAGSSNGGDLGRATWDDLNLPARIPVYLGAGVPLLQRRSPGCVVAAQSLVRDLGVGLLYDDVGDLVDRLHEERRTGAARRAAGEHRMTFTFDHHADRLIGVFRSVAGR